MGHATDDIDYSHCQGRIFRRKEAFLSLPSTLQHDAKQCELYLTAHRDETFSVRHHPPLIIKSVYGCKARELIHMILGWLSDVKVSGSITETQVELKQYAYDIVDALLLDGFVAPLKDSEQKPSQLSRSNSISLQAPPQTASVIVDQETISNNVEESAQTDAPTSDVKLESKDTSSSDSTATASKTYFFRENDILIPVAFSDDTRVSVWDVVDGAIFAAVLKRKAGIFATFTQGKDVYVVVNEKKRLRIYLKEILLEGPWLFWSSRKTRKCRWMQHFSIMVSIYGTGRSVSKSLTVSAKIHNSNASMRFFKLVLLRKKPSSKVSLELDLPSTN